MEAVIAKRVTADNYVGISIRFKTNRTMIGAVLRWLLPARDLSVWYSPKAAPSSTINGQDKTITVFKKQRDKQ